jgi:hypothetical protein
MLGEGRCVVAGQQQETGAHSPNVRSGFRVFGKRKPAVRHWPVSFADRRGRLRHQMGVLLFNRNEQRQIRLAPPACRPGGVFGTTNGTIEHNDLHEIGRMVDPIRPIARSYSAVRFAR